MLGQEGVADLGGETALPDERPSFRSALFKPLFCRRSHLLSDCVFAATGGDVAGIAQ